MAKSVLGNDPFKRGAAPVPPRTIDAAPIPPRRTRAIPEPLLPPPAPPAPPVEAPPVTTSALVATHAPSEGTFAALKALIKAAIQAEPVRQAVAAASGSYRALMTGLGQVADAPLDAYGQDPALVGQLAPLAEFLYARYWRIRSDGADRVPKGAVVLVANHSGALPYDGPVLQYALRRERPDLNEARWLVEDAVFDAPFMGTLLNRLGAVRASPENAHRLLDEERPLFVFPEGVQGLSKPAGERYQLRRFGRGGFVKVALRSRAPIVPVAVVGAEEATPLLAKLPGKFLGLPYFPVTPLGPIPLPSRWRLSFGEPIDLSGHPSEAADDLDLVRELTERTRVAIQELLEAALKDRGGAYA